MDYILELFEQGKEEYARDELMATCFNAGWRKLDKYYAMASDTPIYAAAVVLNPSNKWAYHERQWCDHPEWVSNDKRSVKAFWASKSLPYLYFEDLLLIRY
jgi:hypothetical protein